ncbi:MAG: hypothetical protein WA865_01115 [Spirulinaceae cyanobacterium]
MKGHTNQVRSIVFSSDNRLIASSSDDHTIKLWSLQGSLLKTLRGHEGGVNSLSFSADEKSIISASDDGIAILRLVRYSLVFALWLVASGNVPHQSEKGYIIITWNLDLTDLFNQGCTWLKDYLHNNPNLSQSDRRVCDSVVKYP